MNFLVSEKNKIVAKWSFILFFFLYSLSFSFSFWIFVVGVLFQTMNKIKNDFVPFSSSLLFFGCWFKDSELDFPNFIDTNEIRETHTYSILLLYGPYDVWKTASVTYWQCNAMQRLPLHSIKVLETVFRRRQ